MKRALLASLLAVAAFAVAATPSVGAPATATISVVFSSDFYSAAITSTKGISHYDVVLCDGTTFRVEVSQDTKALTAGPFDAQIVSITVKSATTNQLFPSAFSGDCKKTPPPPPPPK